MHPYPIGPLRVGINRLKVKGGSGSQLYDLVNGFIDQSGSAVNREGTIRHATLSSSTVGLAAMNGVLQVFGAAVVGVPGGYKCNVLLHPTDQTQVLTKIWFAKPFMGFLYVVAQFGNGDIYHYWLQSNGPWAASTVYKNGAIVEPTAPNGLGYLAVRDVAQNPTWTPETTVALNQLVEPTEYTGYYYKATAVSGTAPHTGPVEPTWPAAEGGTVQEFGDFGTSATATGTTTTAAAGLGQTITDRYGDSATIAGQTGTTTSGNAATVTAQTSVTTWAKGTTYAPGAVVQPSAGQGAFIGAIPNGDFEAGNDGNWVFGGSVVYNTLNQYQGTYCIALTSNHGSSFATMNTYGTVVPGQSVTASAYVNPNNAGTDLHIYLNLVWYDASHTILSTTLGPDNQNPGYRKTTVTAKAPASAAYVRVQVQSNNGTSNRTGFADLVTWNLQTPAAVSNFLYEAVQSAAATSGASEPTWPIVAGNTVVDNGVTWKAIGTSIVTWTAIPLMKSGGAEPTWPTSPSIAVKDGTMSWQCVDRHITDKNCPQSKSVALGASHVFSGDKDIVPYCAAVDPTDWTTTSNAGYLPTGLNNYGDNPVAALALYRSNLVAFNSGGYQMWQIDADPANMALLDAQPVGSIWPRATQSVSNDLLFLTEVGVRNLGTVGATANLAIGSTGQPVDPIVRALMVANAYDPLSIYYPGRGQYWLVYGPQAIVLTYSGAGVKTWSRYIFPDAITDWALNAGVLYLRSAGNLVWKFDDQTLIDDSGGANVGFTGIVQWPYMDCGASGVTKELIGIDLVGGGNVNIQVAYQQTDITTFNDNAGFSTSLNVTPPYFISPADTVPGQPIPIPVTGPAFSIVLTYPSGQDWNFQQGNIYLSDDRGGGQQS